MSATVPDPRFHLDDFARTCLNEHGDGYRAGIQWMATHPGKTEVAAVARVWRDLWDGGPTGCETRYYNADEFESFIDYLDGGPYELRVFNGITAMAELNRAQRTAYPAWPERAFAISFDSTHLLGFANACNDALRMGANR
ncbi:hypothetical protein [Nonomuraea guangzhouensis]|uniref:Uncharacterized protein n=1 Tax=Nonomuraea guangzhouensis TaxID=1291555 RepID=A0ABW4GY50_9ACTN|nr:hypothetical protein [Nonomuraea guangzhouensis]